MLVLSSSDIETISVHITDISWLPEPNFFIEKKCRKLFLSRTNVENSTLKTLDGLVHETKSGIKIYRTEHFSDSPLKCYEFPKIIAFFVDSALSQTAQN